MSLSTSLAGETKVAMVKGRPLRHSHIRKTGRFTLYTTQRPNPHCGNCDYLMHSTTMTGRCIPCQPLAKSYKQYRSSTYEHCGSVCSLRDTLSERGCLSCGLRKVRAFTDDGRVCHGRRQVHEQDVGTTLPLDERYSVASITVVFGSQVRDHPRVFRIMAKR